MRAGYVAAGRGGAAAALWQGVRRSSDYNRPSLGLAVLGHDLRRWAGSHGLIVVDHPAVAGALGSRADVWYMHGEMVAPPESIVRSAARVFVPLPETAEEFARGGVARDRLVVTGVCIEPELVTGAGQAAAARRVRIAGAGPLTFAFFSSGAEPAAHVKALALGACALAREGKHRAIVFARRGGRLERAVRREAGRTDAAPRVETFDSRQELDARTARELPDVDVVVSPPHERSNWAVALGLPFLLVGPDLGPFAPRNRALLKARGVAQEAPPGLEAVALPARVARLRADGTLLRMAERGTGPPLHGFASAAETLAGECERRRTCRSTAAS